MFLLYFIEKKILIFLGPRPNLIIFLCPRGGGPKKIITDIDNNINFQDVYTNLKSLNENAPFLFNDFYLDFSQFISFKIFKDKIHL